MINSIRLIIVMLLGFFAVTNAHALTPVELRISEPYLELHTGPSSEYRIEHVLLTGEKIIIKKQHADWFFLQRDEKIYGWAPLKTLLDNRVDSVDMSFDEFLINFEGDLEFDLGFKTGFVEGDYLLGVDIGQWFEDDLRMGINITQVPGKISESLFMTLEMDYFFSKIWSMRPFIKIGAGQLDNQPSAQVIGGEKVSSAIYKLGLGVIFAESKRIKFNAGVALYFPDADEFEDQLQEVSVGLSYFF